MLFVEGFKRPERFLALADRALAMGKPILAVKVGRSPQAQEAAIAHSGSLAGEDRVTDAALEAAGVIRCDDLDELLETAELVAGAGRLGRGVGPGPDRRGDGLHRRGVAGRGPRASGPGSTCRRCPRRPGPRSCATCPRWATSATRSTRGARPTRRSPTRPPSTRSPPPGAYDVLAVVHDCRSGTCRARSRSRATSPLPLIRGHRRSAGPAAGLRLAHGRATSASRSRRRSTRRAACRCCAGPSRRSRRSRGSRGGRAGARIDWPRGPRRAGLAGAGRGAASRGARTRPRTRWRACWRADATDAGPARRAAGAGEPGAAGRRRGSRSRRSGRCRAEADAVVAAWRALGGGPVALKLDAVGLAHKTEAGGVRPGPGRRGGASARRWWRWWAAARAGAPAGDGAGDGVPCAACSWSRWRRPAWR